MVLPWLGERVAHILDVKFPDILLSITFVKILISHLVRFCHSCLIFAYAWKRKQLSQMHKAMFLPKDINSFLICTRKHGLRINANLNRLVVLNL